MNLTVSTASLLSACTKASYAVKQIATLPVIGGLLLHCESGQNRLWIASTNTEQSIELPVECEIKEPGSIVLNATKLLSLIKFSGSETIRIKTADDVATIKYGSSSHRIAGLPMSDFPDINFAGEGLAHWTFPADALLESLKQVVSAQDTDISHYVYNGTNFYCHKGIVEFAAANGRFFSLVQLNIDHGDDGRFVVPAEFTKQAIKLLQDAGDGTSAHLSKSENGVSLQIGLTTLRSQLVSAEYPDYNARLIPKDHIGECDVERVPFLKKIREIAAVGDDEFQRCRVLMEFTPGELRMSSSAKGDETNVSMPCKSSASHKIKIDKRFLEATISPLNAEYIRFEWQERGWLAVKSGNYLGLIAPVRIE